MSSPKVAVIMGSDSDFDKMKACIKRLKSFNIEPIVRVISAHRTPYEAEQFAKNAENEGIEVIIAAAGKAAHLGGVLAAFTTLPVIGVPIKSSTMDGLDSRYKEKPRTIFLPSLYRGIRHCLFCRCKISRA